MPEFNPTTLPNIPKDTDPMQPDAVVMWTPPTVTDNSGVTITPTSTHAPGDAFPIGTTTVTYTAIDPSNRMNTLSFDVIVTGSLANLLSLI